MIKIKKSLGTFYPVFEANGQVLGKKEGIRRLRIDCSLSVPDIALITGFSKRTVEDWCQIGRSNVPELALFKLYFWIRFNNHD